jgi:hypothetical protein
MKILLVMLSFVLLITSPVLAQKADSTNYFLKACGGGFGDGADLTKTIGIRDAGVNKAAVHFIASKMMEAHGGLAKWKAASTLSFTHILVYGQPLETEFWVSNETTEIETERTYHDWPLFSGKLTNDGKRTWTENWQLGNPPGTNVNNIYYAVAIPWLSQTKGVLLQAEPLSRLPGDTTAYFTLKMSFPGSSKHSPHKYYKLFIHPETFLLRGLEFNITYAPFLDLIGLPKEQKSLGPFTHVFYSHTKVDGLIFPEKYDTFDVEGHNSGRHIVYDYSTTRLFDSKRMVLPSRAKIADEKSDR